jgi:hypothetical protein
MTENVTTPNLKQALLLQSPNGTNYKVTVSDAGLLQTTVVTIIPVPVSN